MDNIRGKTRRIWILDQWQTICRWNWEGGNPSRLMLWTEQDLFTVWATDGRQRELPTWIEDAQDYTNPLAKGYPVSIAWGETTLAQSTGSETTLGYIARRGLNSEELEAPETGGKTCRFRPLKQNWSEVELNGETISLRNRERAKDFLRRLWDKDAKCRSKAIRPGHQFPKPSALFSAGERFIKGAGHTAADVSVTSELGTLIHRVYREAVGIVKSQRGAGPHRYYLRAFADSDST